MPNYNDLCLIYGNSAPQLAYNLVGQDVAYNSVGKCTLTSLFPLLLMSNSDKPTLSCLPSDYGSNFSGLP